MAGAPTTLTVQPVIRARGRAVQYAEELGLNTSHENAIGAAEALGILYHQRAQGEADIRHLKAVIEAHVADVTNEVSSQTFASQAAFDRAVKQALVSNEDLQNMQEQLRGKQNHVGEIEAEIRSNEAALRVANARMNELGGYFNYLAASKEALTAERILGQIP